MARCTRPILSILLLIAIALPARAQSTVYHLHKEPSTISSAWQLKTIGPEPPTTTVQSIDLKNLNPTSIVVMNFETQAGVPNSPGTIPAGSTVSIALWMKKTANWGVMYPQARLSLNDYDGSYLCTATGTTAITTSYPASPYTASCQLQQAVTLLASDRFYAAVGVNMTAGPNNHSVKAELAIEGTLNGNYNSRITIPAIVPPPPYVSGLSPTSGPIGTAVTISGQYFGSATGNTVKFGGVTATPTTWNSTTIVAPVPATAPTGPVLVTVGGQNSNQLSFMVTSTGSLAGTITKSSNGSALAGATIDVLRAGVVASSATSNGSGQYATGTLTSGLYAVRVSASGFVPEIRTSVSVGGGAATSVNVALATAGTITGQISASGAGPIAGAAVNASINGVQAGSTTTDGAGAYSLPIKPGTYTVEASAQGFTSNAQTNVVVGNGGSVIVNVTLGAKAPTAISYIYDDLGRLSGVVDATGDTAIYTYDAVGNITAIGRYASTLVSIVNFTPRSGPVGTTVTVSGTGFSPIAANNTVSFNGTGTTATSATATQLTAVVPAGATTGALAVTSPGGSASGAAFTVGNPPSAPTITSFSPAKAAAGTAVTINGTNFQTTPASNTVTVNTSPATVTSAVTSSLGITVPTAGRSGRLKVATPFGITTSSATLFVPPSPYTAAQVGTTQVLPFDVPTTIPTAANTVSLMALEASAGQRVMFEVLNNTGTCAFDLKVYDTSDDLYIWYVSGQGYFNPISINYSGGGIPSVIETRVLPYAGSYTVLIDGCDTMTSSVTLTAHTVPPDQVFAITANGSAVTLGPLSMGQNGRMPFTGTQGQRVALDVASPTIVECNAHVSLLTPGAEVPSQTLGSTCVGFMDPVTLPNTGPYTLFADPGNATTGSLISRLYQVDPDLSGPITVNAPAINVTTTGPGQAAEYTFTGANLDQITVHITNNQMHADVANGYVWVKLLDPNGGMMTNALLPYDSFDLPTQALTIPGQYKVVMDPYRANFGTLSLRVTKP